MSLDEHPLARQGAEVLRQLLEKYELRAMESLVSFWTARGVNLALAEPLVELCSSHSNYTALSTFQGHDWHLALALRLLENTCRPLESDENSTLASFSSQFLGTRTRWETLGIFLSAVLRATMDIPYFPLLYTTDSAKRDFRNILMRQITCALDICLSLDCLNDMQLIFQYENFIIHSFMNGDQSRCQPYWCVGNSADWAMSSPRPLPLVTTRTWRAGLIHHRSLSNFERRRLLAYILPIRISRCFLAGLCA